MTLFFVLLQTNYNGMHFILNTTDFIVTINNLKNYIKSRVYEQELDHGQMDPQPSTTTDRWIDKLNSETLLS